MSKGQRGREIFGLLHEEMARRSMPDGSENLDADERRERARKRRRRRHRDLLRDLPVVTTERVQELARLGLAADGLPPRTYRRESPPLHPKDREILDRIPSVKQPASPAIILFWQADRIIYVGSSIYGLFGHGLAAHYHGASVRAGVAPKDFDRLSVLAVPEERLDFVVAAISRLLRPRHNRLDRRAGYLDDGAQMRRDQEILAAIGIPLAGWRGTSTSK